MVCWLFVGSYIFSSVFGYLGGQQLVEEFFKSLPLNTLTFMLLATRARRATSPRGGGFRTCVIGFTAEA